MEGNRIDAMFFSLATKTYCMKVTQKIELHTSYDCNMFLIF